MLLPCSLEWQTEERLWPLTNAPWRIATFRLPACLLHQFDLEVNLHTGQGLGDGTSVLASFGLAEERFLIDAWNLALGLQHTIRSRRSLSCRYCRTSVLR
jgi:hypothetical protein